MIARFFYWLLYGAVEVHIASNAVDVASQRLLDVVEEIQAELKRSTK